MSTGTANVVLQGQCGLALQQVNLQHFDVIHEGSLVGNVGFFTRGDRTIIISYEIKKKFRKRGFATQAVKMICEWAFTYIGSPRVFATVRKCNFGSQKVLKRNGFVMSGAGRKIYYFDKVNPEAVR